MFLRLGSVAAVVSSRLLPFHPQIDQLLELTHNTQYEKQTHHISERRDTLLSVSPHLQRQHHQSHADHDDHQQLGGPYPRGHVPKADGGEGDDAEVERVEEGEVFACTLQVLDPACAVLPDVTPAHYLYFDFSSLLYLLNCSIHALSCKILKDLPCEDQAQQCADQNEDLVEHGWVGPLDCSVDIILPNSESVL